MLPKLGYMTLLEKSIFSCWLVHGLCILRNTLSKTLEAPEPAIPRSADTIIERVIIKLMNALLRDYFMDDVIFLVLVAVFIWTARSIWIAMNQTMVDRWDSLCKDHILEEVREVGAKDALLWARLSESPKIKEANTEEDKKRPEDQNRTESNAQAKAKVRAQGCCILV